MTILLNLESEKMTSMKLNDFSASRDIQDDVSFTLSINEEVEYQSSE